MNQSIWRQLGIARTADRDAIRRAYTRKLKSTNPEDDAEGFKALRQAYESALTYAAFAEHSPDIPEDSVADEDPAVRIDTPIRPAAAEMAAATVDTIEPEAAGTPALQRVVHATEPASEECASTAGRLRADFSLLAARVAGTDASGQECLRLLEGMLRNPALEDISERLEFETSLAYLLVTHVPRTNVLLVTAARHFDWSKANARVGMPPVLTVAASSAADVEYLEQLRANQQLLSPAYRALTRPPRGWSLRARIVLTRLDRKVWRLLYALRHERNEAVFELDPAALAWWTDYFARPRLSPVALWAMALAPALGAVLGVGDDNAVLTPLSGALLMTLLVGATVATKFLVVDHGRRWFERRYGPVTSIQARLGWLPLGVLVVLAVGLAPTSPLVWALWLPLAIACLAWSSLTRAGPADAAASRGLWNGFLFNLPMLLWLLVMLSEIPAFAVATFAVVALAHVVGESLVVAKWFSTASHSMRRSGAASLLCATVGLLLLIFAYSRDDGSHAALAAASLVLVLLQRTPARMLTEDQLRVRYYAMWGAWIFGMGLARELLGPGAMAVIGTCVWFLCGSILALAMSLHNELKLTRVP